MVWKHRFDRYVKDKIETRKDMSNKLMIFGSNRKKVAFQRLAEIGHVWKESWVTTQGRREVEVGTLLLSNDKNVIAKNVLSYF